MERKQSQRELYTDFISKMREVGIINNIYLLLINTDKMKNGVKKPAEVEEEKYLIPHSNFFLGVELISLS